MPLPVYLPDNALESISKLHYAIMRSSDKALMTYKRLLPLHESRHILRHCACCLCKASSYQLSKCIAEIVCHEVALHDIGCFHNCRKQTIRLKDCTCTLHEHTSVHDSSGQAKHHSTVGCLPNADSETYCAGSSWLEREDPVCYGESK